MSDVKTYEVVVRSRVTLYVDAKTPSEAISKWRKHMENNPSYIEDMFDNAELESVELDSYYDSIGAQQK